MMTTLTKSTFLKLIIINLILVFVVIAAGAIVRATGSGMGCPDWPTCFGKLIPPTNIDQLTWFPNKSFSEGEMIIKDEKLLVALSDVKTGNSFTANNWQEYEKHDYAIFNPLHTWVEFINRLATVVLGFPVMLMFALSFFYWKDKKKNIFLSGLVVFLIGFQAWLGKIVVDRNLQGTTITYHMIGVFAILAVLIWMLHINKKNDNKTSLEITPFFKNVILGSVLLTLLMVILGTQVREEIDLIAKTTPDRSLWIDQLSNIFIIHRSATWLIVIVNGWLLYKAAKENWLRSKVFRVIALIILEVVLGIILSYFNVPAVSQPMHLFVAALIFAYQFDLLLTANEELIKLKT